MSTGLGQQLPTFQAFSAGAGLPFRRAHDFVASHRQEWMDLLTTVETHATARTELDWLLRGLQRAADRALSPADTSAYSILPATLPVYSTFLFAIVPAVAGATVTCRPSSASANIVERFVEHVLRPVGIDVKTVACDRKTSVALARGADIAIFTGSTRSAAALADDLPGSTRMVFQGPGCCAAVVGPEADIDDAARRIVADRTFNNGQDCMAIERVYVHARVADRFRVAVVREASTLRVGLNRDAGTDLGPLLHAEPYRETLAEMRELADVHWLLSGDERESGMFELAVCEAPALSPVVLEEKYGPLLPLVTYQSITELRSHLRAGAYALGVTVLGERRFRPHQFDFSHVAFDSSLYDFEDPFAHFGGRRGTTFVAHAGRRRTGPASLLDEVCKCA